jgi:transketolase
MENKEKIKELNKLRRRMVELDYTYKNGHLASALSCLPIIYDIYKNKKSNDVFILSKGHGSLALYSVLEHYGFNPDCSKLHPDIDIKNGIVCSTGSLGHGLPIAVGMALGKKLKGDDGVVHVLLGDGECAEGTTWESLLFAEKHKLDNLIVWVDMNQYQNLDKTIYDIEKLSNIFKINIIKTIKGSGIKLFEQNHWHVHQLTKQEYEDILEELS